MPYDRIVRFGLLLAMVGLLSSCSWYLQDQIDEQRRRLDVQHQQIQQLQKSQALHQASTNNDIETLRANVQALSGRIEEYAYSNKQGLEALQARCDQLIARLGQVEQTRPQTSPEGAAAFPGLAPSGQPAGGAQPIADDQALYDQAYNAVKQQKFAQARELFDRFITAYPTSNLIDNARYWIGSSYYKERKYEDAIAALDDVIKQYPKGNKAPDALFLQAMAFMQLNDALTAQILLEQLLQSYPQSPAAAEAKKKYDELRQQGAP